MDRELRDRESLITELRSISDKYSKKEDSWKIEIQTTKQKVFENFVFGKKFKFIAVFLQLSDVESRLDSTLFENKRFQSTVNDLKEQLSRKIREDQVLRIFRIFDKFFEIFYEFRQIRTFSY